MLISIIIINYNTKVMTKDCIDSFINVIDGNLEYEIILVDNNSNDGSKEYFKELFSSDSRMKLVFNDKNVGFGNANNIGARLAKGKYLVCVNSDTLVSNFDFKSLIKCFEKNDNIGGLSCKVLNADGSIQTLGFDYPSIVNDFRLNFLFWNFNAVKKIRYRNYKNKGLIKRDWVTGCFLMCERDVFATIGGFDPKIFMYAEDLDLCTRFSKAGKVNYVYDNQEIYHLHGKSSKVSLSKLLSSKKNYLCVIKKNKLSKFPTFIFSMSVVHIVILWAFKKARSLLLRGLTIILDFKRDS